jgi:4,4'-diaponeurosporenoate glycosyltransferase
MSVLPYHVTREAYEELSLFFNLLMVFGAGGFGRLGRARLFGQSLLISRELYQRSGGHAAVRGTILENLAMSKWVEAAGGKCSCLGGRGTLQMRMFPAGIRQLCEGWTKAFTSGAAATDPLVLAVSVFWLSDLGATAAFAMLLHAPWRWTFAGLYACFAAQLFWFARQIGTFRAITCLLYPIPLVFFFGLFTGAVIRRLLKQKVTWRGRQL